VDMHAESLHWFTCTQRCHDIPNNVHVPRRKKSSDNLRVSNFIYRIIITFSLDNIHMFLLVTLARCTKTHCEHCTDDGCEERAESSWGDQNVCGRCWSLL